MLQVAFFYIKPLTISFYTPFLNLCTPRFSDTLTGMETFTLVRPEHLNHYGFLFGGQLLKWVDEYAWLAAARDFPGRILLTRALDRSEFTTSVKSGSILRFSISRKSCGVTSVCYAVSVFNNDTLDRDRPVFSTDVTFVCVDEKGAKQPLTDVSRV